MSHQYSNHCRSAVSGSPVWSQPRIPFLGDQCFGLHFQTGRQRLGIIELHHPVQGLRYSGSTLADLIQSAVSGCWAYSPKNWRKGLLRYCWAKWVYETIFGTYMVLIQKYLRWSHLPRPDRQPDGTRWATRSLPATRLVTKMWESGRPIWSPGAIWSSNEACFCSHLFKRPWYLAKRQQLLSESGRPGAIWSPIRSPEHLVAH